MYHTMCVDCITISFFTILKKLCLDYHCHRNYYDYYDYDYYYYYYFYQQLTHTT